MPHRRRNLGAVLLTEAGKHRLAWRNARRRLAGGFKEAQKTSRDLTRGCALAGKAIIMSAITNHRRTMKTSISSISRATGIWSIISAVPKRNLVIAITFSCIAFPLSALAVTPAPDGGYAFQNTAEGEGALFNFLLA